MKWKQNEKYDFFVYFHLKRKILSEKMLKNIYIFLLREVKSMQTDLVSFEAK